MRETTLSRGDAARALRARRVRAVSGYWSVEGVALRARHPGLREFRVDDYGAPRYPELVLAVTRETLEDTPEEVRAVIRGLQRGYGEVQRDPESAVSAMLEAEPGLDRGILLAQLDAVAPAFEAGAPAYGALDPRQLRAWSRWALGLGVVAKPVDVKRAFDTGLVGRVENP